MNRASGIGLYMLKVVYLFHHYICIICVQGGRKCTSTCTLVQVKSYQCPYKTSTIDVFLKFCCQRTFKNKNISFNNNINRAINSFISLCKIPQGFQTAHATMVPESRYLPLSRGYVFASVSLSVCLSVCVSSRLRKKLLTNFYENVRKGPERAKEQSIRFGG